MESEAIDLPCAGFRAAPAAAARTRTRFSTESYG